MSSTVSLRLPATSANLGPGFDALALALALYLEVDAEPADRFSIAASGRGSAVCGALEGNLLLDTYAQLWQRCSRGRPHPLALSVRNGIPLGMGCGSSAASRLAAVALVSHFGGLGWTRERMLAEAAELEHHPDNAAACCLGGFVAAGYASSPEGRMEPGVKHPEPRAVAAVSFAPPAAWHALLVLPEQPLATSASRAVLPAHYAREAVIPNLQNVALLVAAFAKGDGRLLASATADAMHQPYRGAVCPLLPRLLPLAGSGGILSVTLSGAGSGILLLLANQAAVEDASDRVLACAADPRLGALPVAELLPCGLCSEAAVLTASGSAAVRA